MDNTYVKQILAYKNSIFRHYSSTLEYDSDGNGNFVAFDGDYSEVVSGLRIKSAELNGNFFFTTSDGIKKISALSNSEFTSNSGYITTAGGVKATSLISKIMPDDSGFLPAQSKVSYRLVWGTKDVNNVLVLGSPSSRSIVSNTSKDINIGESFLVSVIDYTLITDGSFFTFDTPNNKYAPYFITTAMTPIPADAQIVNRQLVPIDIQGLTTNAQVAARIGTSLAALSDISVEVSGNDVTVSNNDGGDVLDASQGNVAIGALTVSTVFDGQTSAGIAANVELSFQIPSRVNTNYFYQLYRTAFITADASQLLSDIDPGDEHQLVYEAPITDADVTNGFITVTDITPDSFRAGNAFLYTNPVTGGGIISANEAPPIAQDIALFKNSMFFANTKELQRKQFNLLSVSDFVSGMSKLYVGDSNIFRSYTFVGTSEITDFTVQPRSTTTANSYIIINSANNERTYKVWFDTGVMPTEPIVPNTISIRVPLALYPDTNAGSIQAFIDAFEGITDFFVEDLMVMAGDQVRVSCTNNGPVTDPVDSMPSSGWTFSVFQQGTGENLATGQILLSGLDSVGQAVEETARSIERVINADPMSPVNAYYLSGLDDLPGILLLEARSLENSAFYLAISDAILSTKFNPNLPVNNTITATTIMGNLFTTSGNHGYLVGNQIYLNDGVMYKGVYKIATVPDPNQFTVTGLTITVDQTMLSGVSYLTTVGSDNSVNPNRLYFSKILQPEAVPLVNFIDIGPKDKAIRRILALRDSLVVLKDDGVYIVSGPSAPNFSVRLVDSSAIITAPDTAQNLNNLIYMLSTQGVVTASETGVSVISRNIENRITEVTNNKYNYKTIGFGVTYESDRSYIIWLPTKVADVTATQAYRYNTFTRAWTRWDKPATCGLTNPADDKIYIGSGDNRKFVLKERKNFERQDYADRDFTRSFLNTSFLVDEYIQISNIQDIEVGDTLVQQQTLTINKYNRLLKKLDRDESQYLSDNYFSELKASRGSNMAERLTLLAEKLNFDLNPVPTGASIIWNSKTGYVNGLNGGLSTDANRASGPLYDNVFASGFGETGDYSFDFSFQGLNTDDAFGVSNDGFAGFDGIILASGGTVAGVHINGLLQPFTGLTIVGVNTFNIARVSGTVTMTLNGNVIFTGAGSAGMIKYPTANLRPGSQITMSSSATAGSSFSFTIPTPSGINNPAAHMIDFNNIIEALNDPNSGTGYKDYTELTSYIPFEGNIVGIVGNQIAIQLNYTDNFIEGDFQVYKAIRVNVEYAPQHFGTPEVLKQINQGTLIFDQSNFYGGNIAYATDRAQDYIGVNFNGQGPGYFGGYNWSDVTWGGEGTEYTVRTLIPVDKQRCRYIHVRFQHAFALDKFKLLGISLEPRNNSPRAYR